MQGDLDSRSSEEIATTVREELARLRRSRQWLADAAGLSISTLEKALSGRRPFTLATVVRLEEALGRPLRGGAAPRLSSEPPILAPAELGAYARAGVSWLEGDYLTLRPSFNNRSEEHTSELQSLMRISYAVFCLKKKKNIT